MTTVTPDEWAALLFESLGLRWPSEYQELLLALRAAVAEEREAIARLVEERMGYYSCSHDGHGIAAAIRSRGDSK